MPKPTLSKLLQFHEALKEAPTQPMPKLSSLDLSVIFERRSPVNGRYVAAENCQAAIQKQYPNIFDDKAATNTVPATRVTESVQAMTAQTEQEPAARTETSQQSAQVIAETAPMLEQVSTPAVQATQPPVQAVKNEAQPVPNGSTDLREARRLVEQALKASSTSNGVKQISDAYEEAA